MRGRQAGVVSVVLCCAIALVFQAPFCQGQPCTTGWFGEACQYKCHCTGNSCNGTTGECTDSAICDKGWFGPACQYVDLTTTETTGTGWLYDGDDTTCNNGQGSATVQLNRRLHFTWLRLYVSDTGRNVALKQQTSQSESHSLFTVSLNAVDGNRDGNWNQGSCTETKFPNNDPYWTVSFTHPQTIMRYVLYNRQDAVPNRLLYFKLRSDTKDGTQVYNYQDSKTQPQAVYTVIPDVTSTSPVSSVTIKATYKRPGNSSIPGDYGDTTPILTLCEVETYGDTICPPGSYGRECEHNCNTCEGNTCWVSTGACFNGCITGYAGYQCQTSCAATYWGQGCQQRCSTNCVDRLCNTTNGNCDHCPAGRMGDLCDKACEDTYYGKGCLQRCSTSCKNQLCDKVNGVCDQCPAGKMGDQCNQDCPETFYGDGCAQKCSSGCVNQMCDKVTGICEHCVPGKTGGMCNQDCPQRTYGQDCKMNCSTNCIGRKCNSVSGVCDQCPLGKMGDQCNQVCGDTKYGDRCQGTCSEHCVSQNADARTCDIANGTCVSGCVDGYLEPYCLALVAGDDGSSSSFPIGPVVGGIAGALLIAAIIVGIVLWRKRRRSKNDRLITSNNGSKAKASKSDSNSSSEINGIGNPYNTIETENSVPLTAIVTSGSTPPKPTTKPKPPVKPKKSVEAKDISSTSEKPGKSSDHYNAVGAASTTSILVKDLDNFIKSHDKEFFRKQFSEIPSNNDAKITVGQSHENKAKNRYKNICAYDHSRVLLHTNKEKKQGDYINACYIKGYKQQEKFIASQGATKLMMEDFVRMLWEQRTEKVVMLTNLVEEGKMKCEQYWPDDNDVQMGDIKVTLATTDVCADYTIRRLQLSKEGEGTHLLTQFHFTSWPDKGVPTTPWGLVDFEQRVAWDPTDKPIVVHCSAGVGRTGTFIALRNVMREAEDTGSIDFFTTVKNLRHDRINMVQTAEQYEFLHHAAQVAIICMDTTVTSSDIQERINKLKETSSSGQTHLEKEFNSICLFCAEDDDAVTDTQSDEKSAKNKAYENSEAVLVKAKDRLKNVPAKESYRAILNWENEYMGEYINAVLCPSFTKQNQRILTQLPLPTTVRDFWLMVTQYNVSMVVAFELDLQATDSTIGTYLPAEQDEGLTIPLFKITTSPVTPGEVGDVQTVTVTTDGLKKQKNSSDFKAEEQKVVHITCKKTKLEPSSMLALVKQIRSMRGGDGCIVYMCRNGATYSGLLCVLTLLLDRLDHDLRLTVPLVVGTIKSIRPQVIPTLDQYRLLYQALHMYNESNNVYSNFGDSKPGDGAESNSTQGSGDDDKEKGTIYANA